VIRTYAELSGIMRALVDHRVPFALSTDGPEMLQSYLRDEIALLLRKEILSLQEVEEALATARDASFVDRAPVPGGARPVTDARGNNHAAIALEVEV
jgi:adenosine deaminase